MRKLTSRITIETDEQLKVSLSQNRTRETMLCGGGEPRRILKYMHTYHVSQMAASSSSRFMLLDSFSLTPSWTLIPLKLVCAVMRLCNKQNFQSQHHIYIEGITPLEMCYDLWILCFCRSLSWLTHIAENPCWSEILFPAGRSLVNQHCVSFSVLQICLQRIWRLSI